MEEYLVDLLQLDVGTNGKKSVIFSGEQPSGTITIGTNLGVSM
ncbi:hypothetical protein [Radiobacillus sp. PE A8.2]